MNNARRTASVFGFSVNTLQSNISRFSAVPHPSTHPLYQDKLLRPLRRSNITVIRMADMMLYLCPFPQPVPETAVNTSPPVVLYLTVPSKGPSYLPNASRVGNRASSSPRAPMDWGTISIHTRYVWGRGLHRDLGWSLLRGWIEQRNSQYPSHTNL